MQVYLNESGLNLKINGGLIVKNITAFIDYRGDSFNTLTITNDKWKIENTESGCIACDGKFTVTFTEINDKVFIKGEYKGGARLDKARKFCFFKGKVEREFNRAYVNGSTECNGVKTNNMQVSAGVTGLIHNQRVESIDFVVGISQDNACLTVGAAEYKENYASVELCSSGEVMCVVDLYDHYLPKEYALKSDNFVVYESDCLQNALKEHVECVQKFNSDEYDTIKKSQSGWCSWYYYGPNISEKIILENAKRLKEKNIPVDVVQIDDGWFDYRGDWNANQRFPNGIKHVADEIVKYGFKPGIWVTPLTADNDSELFKNNRDMFVKEWDSDKIFGTNSIDFSTEKARKYLYDLFRKLSYDYGFRYIKFDFVGFGISTGRYFDPSFNAVKNLRAALKIMKSAVTPDTFLLSCTSPVISPIGLTDGLRISVDIFERWESVKHVASQVFSRMYLNGGITIDPDCALMRNSANEDSECFRKCIRTENEIETLVTVIGVSGGSCFISDKLSLLDDAQISKFTSLLPPNQVCGVPVDQADYAIPRIINCGNRNGTLTVALFNFEDFEQSVKYSLDKKYRIYDFWNKKYLGEKSELNFNINPHSCKVLHCADASNSFSVTGCENRIVPDLEFEIIKDGVVFHGLKTDESVILYSEKEVVGENCAVASLNDNLYRLTTSGKDAKIIFKNV